MAISYTKFGHFAAIGWCTLGVGMLGLIFMIAGSVITGIAYTEITPPNYDENYDRYIGASVPRLIGPFLIIFGVLLLFGSCGFFGVAFYFADKNYEDTELSRDEYGYSQASTGGGNEKQQA